MTGDFGKFINEKRLGRASDGSDILLKDIAQAMELPLPISPTSSKEDEILRNEYVA